MVPTEDYYAILNVDPSASTDEIQKAYKSLSRTFHPDRLRARNQTESEMAQETFVRIKAAHDILCDPVYRFAYDQYGEKGVRYLQTCEQAKQSQRPEEHQFGWDLHLYSKLKKILEMEDHSQRLTLAIRLLKQAIGRWELELEGAKQRLRDSLFDFDATIELPCAYYPNSARLMGDTSPLPYLELEKSRLDFAVKASNLVPQKLQQEEEGAPSTPRGPQQHILTGSFGAGTKWESTGLAGSEMSLGIEYQKSEAAATKWNCEVTAPVSQVNSKKTPVIIELSSSHRFASGTSTVAGLRGSTANNESWQYSLTSTRIVPKKRLQAIFPAIGEGADIRATCGLGIQVLTGDPSTFFISCMNLPAKRKSQENAEAKEDHQSSASFFSSPWVLSNPRTMVRCGYNIPFETSITYEEFGKAWSSLDASWSYSSFSKIKVMLSTDLWGSYGHNDTTTIRTGLKHDLMTGWIWLWEWEELDWTLKVPISLSASKNASWILMAMGSELPPAGFVHDWLGGILACYVTLKVAGSMVNDWTSTQKTKEKGRRQGDATTSEDHDSFRESEEENESTHRKSVFSSLMEKVAERKRQAESAKDGLVIRSAILYKGTKRQLVSSADDDADVDSFLSKPKENNHGLTDILQFWVQDSKLTLPPLSTQQAPHYYMVGDTPPEESSTNNGRIWPLINVFSRVSEWFLGGITDPNLNPVELSIRYQFKDNVYEVTLRDDDPIELPDSNALLLGPSSRIK